MLTTADAVANECSCQRITLAMMIPMPVPRLCLCQSEMMTLNASVNEEYACADAKDADVCRCTRCQCLPMQKMSMSTDAKVAYVCQKNAKVCLYQPMLMPKPFPMQTVTMTADAVANGSRCLC